MKITKRQLMRIIKEEKHKADEAEEALTEKDAVVNGDHHWPRVDWTNIESLTDKWQKLEGESFDKGDPSMMGMGETEKESRDIWAAQVESAAMDFEVELTQRVRKVALETMKEFSEALMNGDYY